MTVYDQLVDIYHDVNMHAIAVRYFGKSQSWLYNKIHQRTISVRGKLKDKPENFSPVELNQFKDALYDLANRIKSTADRLG